MVEGYSRERLMFNVNTSNAANTNSWYQAGDTHQLCQAIDHERAQIQAVAF